MSNADVEVLVPFVVLLGCNRSLLALALERPTVRVMTKCNHDSPSGFSFELLGGEGLTPQALDRARELAYIGASIGCLKVAHGQLDRTSQESSLLRVAAELGGAVLAVRGSLASRWHVSERLRALLYPARPSEGAVIEGLEELLALGAGLAGSSYAFPCSCVDSDAGLLINIGPEVEGGSRFNNIGSVVRVVRTLRQS